MIALLLAGLALSADVAPDDAPPLEEDGPELVAEVAGPDRSAPPPVAAATPLPQPAMEVDAVRPGLDVVLVRTPGLRKARISLMFRRGSNQLGGVHPASYDAFGWVWDQATKRRSGDDLAVYEDKNEIDVWSVSGADTTTVHLDTPTDDLGPGLSLLREVVVEPRFVGKDLKLIRENRLRWYLVESSTDGGALIQGGLDNLWVPEGHPLSDRPDVVGWRDLKKKDVIRHHRELLAEAPLTVLVVGDMDMDRVRAEVVPALDGLGVAGEPPKPPAFTPPKTSQVIGVDLYGTGRASIGLRMAAPTLDDPDAPAFRLIDHAMGGHFLSRLNADLREVRGLTYGIDSSFGSGQSLGAWTIMTEVRLEDAGEAIGAIDEQLTQLAADGLTENELGDGVRARISGWNATLQTTDRASTVYGSRVRLGWSTADARERLDAYAEVTPARSQEVARRWIEDQPRAWVIVGERSALQPQLDALDMEVTWLPGELVILGAGVGPVAE